jgi:hypothetical protein
MALTLKNYLATLPADLQQQAKKNTVRECDETEKGHFVAYVDDGSDSFDVSLTLKAGNEITRHSCECKSAAGFCRHKTALIMHIANGKKAKVVVVKARQKESIVDTLLGNVEPDKLKEWVKAIIGKNKDLELSFVHYFSVKVLPTPAEVVKIVNDAVKAVAGNKRTIDQTQLKKLVELWGDMLTPIVEHYQTNVTDEKSFVNLHTMLETCIAFQFKVDSASNKIPKFIEECLLRSVEHVNMLRVEEAWDKAVSFFVNHVPDRINSIRMHYLVHLQNIINVSTPEQKIKIIDWLAWQLEKSNTETLINGEKYLKFIFKLVVEHNLFAKYSKVFKPIRFDNEYNQQLLTLLIAQNELKLVKQYCREQIGYNYREEYSVIYWAFLKDIAVAEKDEKSLVTVSTALFPWTFNFDDYLFISQSLPEEERKKWRTKMLAKAKNTSGTYKKNAVEFYFKLADTEKTYRKMIEYIRYNTPYAIILQYFEPMAMTEKDRFFEAIINKSDDYGWGWKTDDDSACLPQLYQLFVKHYTADYLKMVIKSTEKNRYFRQNDIVSYITKQLYS